MIVLLPFVSKGQTTNGDDRREKIIASMVNAIEVSENDIAINIYHENEEILHDGELFEALSRYYFGYILYCQEQLDTSLCEMAKSCEIIDGYLEYIFDPEVNDGSATYDFAIPYYYMAIISERLGKKNLKELFEKAFFVFNLAKLNYTEAHLYILKSMVKYGEPQLFKEYVNLRKIAKEDFINKNYNVALPELKSCIEILDKFQYPLVTEYGLIYQALGHISNEQQNLCDCEYYIKKGLYYVEPYSSQNAEMKKLCISLYLDLSNIYGRLKDSESARLILDKSLKLFDSDGEYCHDYLGIINNYAILQEECGIETLENVIEIIHGLQNVDNEDLASMYFNLAVSYGTIGKWDKSIELLNIATESLQNCDNMILKPEIHFLKGLICFLEGNYIAAKTETSKYRKELVNSGVIEADLLYTMILFAMKDNNLFKEIASSILKFKQNILANFIFLSERQRYSFWESVAPIINGYNRLIFEASEKSKKYSGYIYDNILFTKGLLLKTSKIVYDEINSNTESLHWRLNIEENNYNDIEDIEKELLRDNVSYSKLKKYFEVCWKDIKKKLHKGQVAIEFTRLPKIKNNNFTGDFEYAAIILSPDFNYPEVVTLFDKTEFIECFNETVENTQQLYESKTFSKLIWGNLAKYLKGCNDVYFSPDGVLHQIAIEYLPDYDNPEKQISDRFNLYRLSSTRELALDNRSKILRSGTIYGGIIYDSDPETMLAESRKYEKATSRGIETYYNVADSLSSARSRRGYLKQTLIEAENLDSLLKSSGYNAILITGNEATEESFKNISGKEKGILHIATHGFYWEADEADYNASINERLMFMCQTGNNARKYIEDKALTRTGLLMAGANNVLSGKKIPEDVDDGILTAKEIADLDLRDLDLVVLSACQTGMGDISGDGVFGLQRGFKKAGANSILMSLWDVDDEATQILMTEFYKNYLGGMSKQEALNTAQKVLRETPGFEDPYYWAAFILLDGLN